MAPTDDKWHALIRALLQDPHDEGAAATLRRWLVMLAKTLHLPPEVDIDDLVQNTYIQLLGRGGLERVRHPASFLRMSLRWRALDELRTRRRRDELRQLTNILPVSPPTPAEIFDASMRQKALDTIWNTLTVEERRLLELRFWEEESITAIAARLNISYSAAAVRIFRVLSKLRGALRDVSLRPPPT